MSRRKRAFDIAAALAALLAFLPLLALIALVIWVETGGPVLFRQARGGLCGLPIGVFKFRTMHVAEDGGAIRQVTADDARVTRAGRILRKLSLDELPQLLNVLLGDMSIVGPRPHALAHDRSWAAIVAEYPRRFRTRPGLTGLAQVRGHRGLLTDTQQLRDRVAADIEYIETWSFRQDLRLIVQTVPLVFHDPAAI